MFWMPVGRPMRMMREVIRLSGRTEESSTL